MRASFDPFEYQLNLGPINQSNPSKDSQQQSFVAVLITPKTDIYKTAQQICQTNNLNSCLVKIIEASIEQEIQNQKQQKILIQTKIQCSGLSKKTKNFKIQFCQFLHEHTRQINEAFSSFSNTNSAQSHSNSIETFKNSSLLNDSNSHINNKEYSFRPNCLQTVELNNLSFQNRFELNQSTLKFKNQAFKSENCSPKLIRYSSKVIKQPHFNIFTHQKQRQNKNHYRTVFDNLYSYSKFLQIKKEINRKKSFQKLTFQPKLNSMSKKIVEMKKKSNPQIQSSLNSIHKSSSKTPSIQSKSMSKPQKSQLQQNMKPSCQVEQNSFSIYERGILYRKKSQEKLGKIKQKQFRQQIKACSFQPKIYTKYYVQKQKSCKLFK